MRMPMSEAQKRATRKWDTKSYDRLTIRVYKGQKALLEEYLDKYLIIIHVTRRKIIGKYESIVKYLEEKIDLGGRDIPEN